MKLLGLLHANDDKHKYIAEFETENGLKHIRFGAFGYESYIDHKNTQRKKAYLARHESRENWNDPMTPGSLSRWLLWNKTTLKASMLDFRKRFDV